MEYRKLGRSPLEISEISLGCWAMGGDYWGPADDRESIATIEKALEGGINFFDTAELYGRGHSEEVLGKALKKYRDKVYISTKVWRTNMRKQDVKRACENSLKRLQTDYIDVYFIHYPSDDVPIEETMEAMQELKEEGKIRVIGLSNFSLEQMKEALRIARYEVIQPCYNLLWRFIEKDVLPFCRENEIGIVAYSPLAQGLLTGKFTKDWTFPEGDGRKRAPLFQPEWFSQCIDVAEALKPFAEKYGKTQAQVAINWINAQSGITSSIVGARRPEQIQENLGATGWRLSDEDIEVIDKISRKVTDRLPRFQSFFVNKVIEG